MHFHACCLKTLECAFHHLHRLTYWNLIKKMHKANYGLVLYILWSLGFPFIVLYFLSSLPFKRVV
jgi:hypothetical protein